MSTSYLKNQVETRYALGRGHEAWRTVLLDADEAAKVPEGPVWRQIAARWALCGHPDGLLLQGTALGDAERWVVNNSDEVESLERDYLAESRRAIITRQRQAATSRMVNAFLVVITIAALLVVRLWLGTQEEAESQRQELHQEADARATVEAIVTLQATLRAQAEATLQAVNVHWREAKRRSRLSEVMALASQAKASLSPDTRLAMLLAIEAIRRADSGRAPEASVVAQEVLYQALGHEGWDRIPTSGEFASGWASSQDLILAMDPQGQAAIWKLPGSARQVVLDGQDQDIQWAAWNHDASQLLTLEEHGTLSIWNAASGTRLLSLDVGERVTRASWSADGGYVLAMAEGRALAWDAESGAEAYLLPASCAPASAAWSPDGTRVVGIDSDGQISTWQVPDGRLVCRLADAGDAISGLYWEDGNGLIVGRDGMGAERVWDAKTGQGVTLGLDPLQGHHGSQTPRQGSLPVREADGHLYFALASDLADCACTALTRNLTTDEWARYLGGDVPYRPTCPRISSGRSVGPDTEA